MVGLMACLGMQILSYAGDRRVRSISGGFSDEQLCRSITVFGDHRRRQWRNPRSRMCLDGRIGESKLRLETKSGHHQKKPIASPHLDQLMNESVAEIVKNINGAPFLAQIYSEGDENRTPSASPLRVVIYKATSEAWPYITESWEAGGNLSPDGVILVQELRGTEKDEVISITDGGCCTRKEVSSDRVWGLVVQGRGVSYPACYILKTCQVQCCFGFLTHYCVAKVDCFGKDVDFHLNKFWLQS